MPECSSLAVASPDEKSAGPARGPRAQGSLPHEEQVLEHCRRELTATVPKSCSSERAPKTTSQAAAPRGEELASEVGLNGFSG